MDFVEETGATCRIVIGAVGVVTVAEAAGGIMATICFPGGKTNDGVELLLPTV